jgi:hypothetical protein
LVFLNGSGIPEANVLLAYVVTGGESWNDITAATTASDGSYSVVWMPTATGSFTIRTSWGGDAAKWIRGSNATADLAVTQFNDQYVFSVISNATVTNIAFNSTDRELSFTVTGSSDSTGYVNVTVAKALIADPANIRIFLNTTQLGSDNYVLSSADDSWLLHFTFTFNSTYAVTVRLGATSSSPPAFDYLLYTIVGVVAAVAIATTMLIVMKKKKM